MIVKEASGRHLELQLNRHLYNEAVVFKCFYWYGGTFDVEIDSLEGEDGSIAVILSTRDGVELSGGELQQLISRVRRDLIDFKTRDIVAGETKAIRELLVAKAFASSDELDEPPVGIIRDLGGVEPREPRHEGT